MTFFEKDLEEIIYEADKELLCDRGLSISGKLYRQMKIGSYGIADLVEIVKPEYVYPINSHEKGVVKIYELKKDKISLSTFMQAVGYAKGVSRYLGLRTKDNLFNIEIILIGKTIDLDGEFVYLTDLFNYKDSCSIVDTDMSVSLNLYAYDYKLDGIFFNRISNYHRYNEGFKL